MSSAGLSQFQLTFQLSPIILTGGIAANVPGGMLPIISLTEGESFDTGILSSGSSDLDPEDFFANFQPLPGATLIDVDVATYPFANNAVAANAIINNPFTISLLMICPARSDGGYADKLSTITSLQASLSQHINSGGTFTVATPSYYYTNCLMTKFIEASSGQSKQPQDAWQLDFFQPLLTLDQAAQSYNSLMNKIASGTPIQGQPSYSGLPATVGQPPSLAAPSVIPAASGLGGAGVAATNGPPRTTGTDQVGP